jgi:uncharacterized coiled-coil protein SlyX
MSIDVMKQALEALIDATRLMDDEGYTVAFQEETITTLRTAIAEAETQGPRIDYRAECWPESPHHKPKQQPEAAEKQEPVVQDAQEKCRIDDVPAKGGLLPTLPAAQRQPLTNAEDIAQDWDLLKETQAALRDAWAILKKLKAVQDAARELVESDPDSAADTEGEAFAAWCALVDAIDDADTLLCEFGESRE